jgi:hypothetical protein
MRPVIASLLLVAAFSPAQAEQTFTGVITDDVCAKEGHAGMRMGPTDAECARLCVTVHGARYVLSDGKDVYELSDQRTPEEFAARKVKVVGTLDAASKTIRVKSITAAE